MRPDLCKVKANFNTCSLPCQIASKNIECTGTPGKYNFDFTLSNSYPGCTVQVVDLASGSIVPITISGSLYSGIIMNPTPFSNPANYQVQVICNGQVICSMMLQYTLPCCMKTGKQKIECDKLNPGFYNFAFEILGVVNPTNICNVSMYDLSNGNAIAPLTLIPGINMITVSGSMPPSTLASGNYQIVIDCPNSPLCTLNVFYKHPCCNPLSLNDLTVCSTDNHELLPLNGCGSLTGIQAVRWYVNTWPCLGTPIGANPYQVNGPSTCNDLVLLPNLLPSSPAMFCIKAEVDHICFGMFVTDTTNHAKLTLCDPPTVSVSPSLQEFCSTSITPLQLNAVDNSSLGCDLTYQWYQNGSIISGATLSTYLPTGLSFGGAGSVTDGCRSIYNFSVTVTGFCGQATATAQIIIYDNNADPGSLALCSAHTLPLCCDDAVKVCYIPGCIYPKPAKWSWSFKNLTTNPSWTPMPYAGDMNPLWLTNKICEDHWFRESQNGVCPVDQVDIYLPVKLQLQTPIFTATLDDNCSPTGVNMTVTYTPCISGLCNYTICWFHDGILIGTTNSTTSSSSFFI
ncbi:MAG: hypothetical protein IPH36_22710 [Saprospiraceae bacterium]|nr:hypothetical protein [Saprospiraceae bacterium]